jgi:hypothetical protein
MPRKKKSPLPPQPDDELAIIPLGAPTATRGPLAQAAGPGFFDLPAVVQLPNALVELPRPAPPPPTLAPSDAIKAKQILAELRRRQIESLRLYEPLPKLDVFHAARNRIRLLIGSNRAGKTCTSSVEFARAVTGQDPHGKYPKKNGIAFVFGKDQKHLGSVIHRKLFRAGAFKIVRDEQTGEWRAAHLVNDAHREKEFKPAPPLIPPRFIKSTAWEQKKTNVPQLVKLHNGWEIHFFSGLGSVPQGQDIDLFWIDEEVSNEELIDELNARIADRAGCGIWSATPQAASQQLFDLNDRAVLPGDPGAATADVLKVKAHILDNPHIAQDQKEAMYRGWNDEQKRIRWDGEFAYSGFIIYPEFSRTAHNWPATSPIGKDWSRWLSIDPGRQRCAVTFLAVPPPDVGKFAVIYDELYIERCDAESFGRQVALKSEGVVYEGAVIDGHAARQTEMGSGRSVEDWYRDALERHGVEIRGGVRFLYGSDDPQAGREAVHNWLRFGTDGKPYLRVCLARCKSWQWEVERYRYKADPHTKQPTDTPIKLNDHLMDTTRYLAMRNPRWVQPAKPKAQTSGAVRSLEAKRKRKTEANPDNGWIHLGPGRGGSPMRSAA